MRYSITRPREKPADDISETPQAIVIRSLRRRLCQAFCEGNVNKALCIYKAQRSDWERWAELEKEAVQKSASKDLSRQMSNLTLQLTNDSQDVIGLLQAEMNPTEFFRADDYLKQNDPYNDEVEETIMSTPLPKPKRREPFSMFRFGDKGNKEDDHTGGNDDSKLHLTTPLHEAARLGCGELVRLMLAHDSIDCQRRNGQCRTPLHMVAGGIVKDDHVGIGPLVPPKGDLKPALTSASKLRNFFRRKGKSDVAKPEPGVIACSMESRVDALRAIISWSEQREAFSTNSVDSHGKTALHYAAELGREEICHELLSSFGANLTIVDDMGMNPCEKAAEQNYHDLAAFLEAKAVLYIDPFGMDNELYESSLGLQHLNGFSRQTLAPPFSWFKTLVDVQKERERRRDIMEIKMKKILSLRIEKEELKARILARSTRDDVVESSATKTAEKSSDTPRGKPEFSLDGLRWFLGRVRSCHAEVLLSSNKWNLNRCAERFYIDPIQMLRDAGLQFQPDSLDDENKTQVLQTCLICCEEFNAQSAKWERLSNCSHQFCRDCLSDYVSNCAKSRVSCFKVTCPHHECNAPLLQSELADFASSSDYALLVDKSNADFVVAAYDVRYCPHPGCAGVVQFNASVFRESIEHHLTILKTVGAVCTYDNDGDHHGPMTYEGVYDTAYYGTQKQPKLAHRFCFDCGEGMHWPISCRQLEEWKEVVKEHVQEVSGAEDSDDYKDVAQKLWMKANTRPCPKVGASWTYFLFLD
jgi:ankyrin repeat protein